MSARVGAMGLVIAVAVVPASAAFAGPMPGAESALPGTAAPKSEDVERLLESARFWAARKRNDLERQMLRRVLLVEPTNAEALAGLGLAPAGPAMTVSPVSPVSPIPPVAPAAHKTSIPLASAPPPHRSAPPDTAAPPAPPPRVDAPIVVASNAVADLARVDRLGVDAPALAPRTGTANGTASATANAAANATANATASGNDRAARTSDHSDFSVATGVTAVREPGSAARSRLATDTDSLALHWRLAAGSAWLQFDRVRLDAGAADASALGRWPPFGTAALPGYPVGASDTLAGRASGTAASVGFDTETWRADFGHTPSGFLFARGTWGVRVAGAALGEAWSGWRFSAARRPVTSTVLAYAGQRDLATGLAWGGVDRTSLAARVEGQTLAAQLAGWTPYGEAAFARYRGENVESNRERVVTLGLSRTVLDAPDAQLILAPNFTWRAFSNGQNHFTLGQGGYWSPQRAVSVALPLQWVGRAGATSFGVRAAVSLGRTRTDDALRFPTRPDLQQLAAAQDQARYEGSSATSIGRALQVSLEHRLAPRWAAGLRLGLERSPDYAQDRAQVYLRWTEAAQEGAAPLWPSPLFPNAER